VGILLEAVGSLASTVEDSLSWLLSLSLKLPPLEQENIKKIKNNLRYGIADFKNAAIAKVNF
jgi:hypothetical protein